MWLKRMLPWPVMMVTSPPRPVLVPPTLIIVSRFRLGGKLTPVLAKMVRLPASAVAWLAALVVKMAVRNVVLVTVTEPLGAWRRISPEPLKVAPPLDTLGKASPLLRMMLPLVLVRVMLPVRPMVPPLPTVPAVSMVPAWILPPAAKVTWPPDPA